MRVLGYALGGGSTLYETAIGQFFLYPQEGGGMFLMWDKFLDGEWQTVHSAHVASRSNALTIIETRLRAYA